MENVVDGIMDITVHIVQKNQNKKRKRTDLLVGSFLFFDIYMKPF